MTPIAELLTEAEFDTLDTVTLLVSQLNDIVGEGTNRAGDLTELSQHVHAIQALIMSQAAARAFPDKFRLLGASSRHPTESMRPDHGKEWRELMDDHDRRLLEAIQKT
jgi:hypothetical protein